MSRPTKLKPDLGNARSRLIESARLLFRTKGFAATSVEDVCSLAAVSKGAYFHQFKSKDALGVAVAEDWTATTSAFFAAAPYQKVANPLQRILAYIDFRKQIIGSSISEASCLAGTVIQETYATSSAIRDACGQSILGHAATLEPDFSAAMANRSFPVGCTAESLSRFTQTVIQGAFVIAKAGNNTALARDSLDHLDRYIRLLFAEAKSNHGGRT